MSPCLMVVSCWCQWTKHGVDEDVGGDGEDEVGEPVLQSVGVDLGAELPGDQ